MRKETVEWTIRMLVDLQDRINTDEEYQRANVWSRPQQALLIDSILRGFDIPKIYVRKLPPGGDVLFDVIDGKQRLTAIWRFLSDDFSLPRNSEIFPDLGDLSGKRWSQLPASAQDILQFASITVSALEDASKDNVHELFLRLQMGEPLRAAEKRNAIAGPVRDFVVERMAIHPFWSLTGIREARFGYHEHSAILLAIVMNGGATALKGPDLQALYETTPFDPDGALATQSLDLLDELDSIASLGQGVIKTRWGLVDLAIAILRLRNESKSPSSQAVMDFFRSFEDQRREVAVALSDLQSELVEKTLNDDNDDLFLQLPNMSRQMLTYHLAFTREGATKDNVRSRSDILYRLLNQHIAGTN